MENQTEAENGILTAELFAEGRGLRVPVAVQNYRTEVGWNQAEITDAEARAIDTTLAFRNGAIVARCIREARTILEIAHKSGLPKLATPTNIVELAMFLAERRLVPVSRVYDEFLTAKVAAERRAFTEAEAI